MARTQLESGIPPLRPSHEVLPQNFYNLLQRELILHWTRRKTGNPEAGLLEADEQVVSWVEDGYSAAYRTVYARKEMNNELAVSDLQNESLLQQWLIDLDREIILGHASEA